MYQTLKNHLDDMIPTPKKLDYQEKILTIPAAIATEHDDWQHFADTFSYAVEKLFDLPVAKAKGGVILRCDESLAPQSYVLDSMGDTLILSAADDEAIVYAIASALLLIEPNNGGLSLIQAHIEDTPDKDYRTLMVDLAREWHPAFTIFRYIDVCFMLKIRYLHLHFIDDQRYTLPSRIFPKLTAANRSYTFEEIEAMRAYAKDRGVILVPEFEVPGHAAMLVKQYPEIFALHLQSDDDTSLVTEEGAVITAENIICAGSEVTMNAVKDLLAEICEMFPETPYIHIGGDEANIKAWNSCSECVRYMKEHNIKDVYELYSEFTGRVAQFVLDCGKTPIVWEGFPKDGVAHIPKETIVIAWESHYHMAYDLLDAGFRVINGSWQPLYIVNSYSRRWGCQEILDWNVYNWQHWWEHSEAKLNPIHVQPTDRVLGAQITSWQCTYEQEINNIMENLATLSERTWNVRRLWEYKVFDRHLKRVLQRVARYIQDV